MSNPSSQSGLWRAPAWGLLIGFMLLSAVVGSFGTGPFGLLSGESAPGLELTLNSIVAALAPGVLPLLALGVLFSAASVGPRATLTGMAWVCGSRKSDPLQAARALAAGARGLIAAALILGLIGVMMLMVLYRRGAEGPDAMPAPHMVAHVLTATIQYPLVALVFGRLLCATVADAAFAEAGEVRRRALGSAWDLALLTLMVPPIIAVSSMFWKYPTL
jgi:hypothetical protein